MQVDSFPSASPFETLALAHGIDGRVLSGHDPDSFVRAHGADAVSARLDSAIPIDEWIARQDAFDAALAKACGETWQREPDREPVDISIDALFQRERHASADVEGAIVGALITGALRPSDMRDVDELELAFVQTRGLYLLVASLVRERGGVSLDTVTKACLDMAERFGVSWNLQASRARLLAHRAPKRPKALEALRELRRLACEREDAERRRLRAIDVWLHWVKIDARKVLAETREEPVARGTWRVFLARRRYLRRVRRRMLRRRE